MSPLFISRREFLGELLGTFLLVFFGLSTVAGALTLGIHVGLFPVALLWGLALLLAITFSIRASGAHLNPAITLASASVRGFAWKKVPAYIVAQCLGSLLGALMMYALFSGSIAAFEDVHHLTRGAQGSELSSMVFGEYYPNPALTLGQSALQHVTLFHGFLAETFGTFLLALLIFSLSSPQRKDLPPWLFALLIGLALSVIIAVFAPFSMGGFNPARDFMPRALASCLGWGNLPFTHNGMGWLVVYILGPIIGAQLGALGAQSLESDTPSS